MAPSQIWISGFTGLNDGVNGTVYLYDADQRRFVTVTRSLPELEDEDEDEQWYTFLANATQLLLQNIDKLDPEVIHIKLEEDGSLSTPTDDDLDFTSNAHYVPFEEYRTSATDPKTVLRSELTEIGRLAPGVDLVSNLPITAASKPVAFKYYHTISATDGLWSQVNILSRLPPHPNLLPLDRLVLEENEGSGVVGFTMPFIPGGDFGSRLNRPQVFKMKWLKQLIKAVDFLNLRFGIVHQDIAPRNLLLDSDTDNLILFDFDIAAKFGAPARWGPIQDLKDEDPGGPRNDLKGVVTTVYEIITRDPAYKDIQLHLVNEADVSDLTKWIHHQDVQLDPGLDVLDYYNELMTWVTGRRSANPPFTHYTQAPEYIDWPDRPKPAPDVFVEEHIRGEVMKKNIGGEIIRRPKRRKHGVPYLDWERPAAHLVDHTRRLLATGKYSDENQREASAISAAKQVQNQDSVKLNPKAASEEKPQRPVKRSRCDEDALSAPEPLPTRRRSPRLRARQDTMSLCS